MSYIRYLSQSLKRKELCVKALQNYLCERIVRPGGLSFDVLEGEASDELQSVADAKKSIRHTVAAFQSTVEQDEKLSVLREYHRCLRTYREAVDDFNSGDGVAKWMAKDIAWPSVDPMIRPFLVHEGEYIQIYDRDIEQGLKFFESMELVVAKRKAAPGTLSQLDDAAFKIFVEGCIEKFERLLTGKEHTDTSFFSAIEIDTDHAGFSCGAEHDVTLPLNIGTNTFLENITIHECCHNIDHQLKGPSGDDRDTKNNYFSEYWSHDLGYDQLIPKVGFLEFKTTPYHKHALRNPLLLFVQENNFFANELYASEPYQKKSNGHPRDNPRELFASLLHSAEVLCSSTIGLDERLECFLYNNQDDELVTKTGAQQIKSQYVGLLQNTLRVLQREMIHAQNPKQLLAYQGVIGILETAMATIG